MEKLSLNRSRLFLRNKYTVFTMGGTVAFQSVNKNFFRRATVLQLGQYLIHLTSNTFEYFILHLNLINNLHLDLTLTSDYVFFFKTEKVSCLVRVPYEHVLIDRQTDGQIDRQTEGEQQMYEKRQKRQQIDRTIKTDTRKTSRQIER